MATNFKKKLFKRTEFYLFLVIIGVSGLIQMLSGGVFFQTNNLVDMIRSVIITAMLGVGAQMVIISGGTDISFTALASLAEYAVVRMFMNLGGAEGYEGGVFVIYAVAALIGLGLGAINGFIIAKYRLPVLIVTLGTSNIFSGILYGALNAKESRIPISMKTHAKDYLVTVYNESSGLQASLPKTVLILFGVYAFAFFILRYTTIGRGIYAIGGDETAAKRAGFNVFGIKMFIYCFVGIVAAIAGIARTSTMLTCNPGSMVGMEMTVIAAVVLGGTSVNGGSGTLLGTFLGTLLLTIISNSLILIGVSMYWQKVCLGIVIIVGTGLTAYQRVRRENRLTVSHEN